MKPPETKQQARERIRKVNDRNLPQNPPQHLMLHPSVEITMDVIRGPLMELVNNADSSDIYLTRVQRAEYQIAQHYFMFPDRELPLEKIERFTWGSGIFFKDVRIRLYRV